MNTKDYTNVTAADVVTYVTVREGAVRRQYEQTASRDHNVTLTPGVYAVTPQVSREGWLNRYTAAIPTASGETYGLSVYGYEVTPGTVKNGLIFS